MRLQGKECAQCDAVKYELDLPFLHRDVQIFGAIEQRLDARLIDRQVCLVECLLQIDTIAAADEWISLEN